MSEEIVYSAVKLKGNSRESENTGTREHGKGKEHIGDVEYGAVTFRRNEMHNQKQHPTGCRNYFRLAGGALFILLICAAVVLFIMFSGSSGGQCSDGWESFSGSCYYFPHDALNWTASRNQCMSVGGHLVIIDRKEEQIYITQKINKSENDFWIGLTDSEKEGQWKWVDNTDLKLKFWHKAQPNNSKGFGNHTTGEDCGIVRHVTRSERNWFDEYCGSLNNRICEV
ncbi:C-type lectin domain family 4 member E-like [Clupea harengus]|uniref:C-type lectin domain family 4 member E-like n=1 Tax=Clupea harengus TaxID=7950 RepID=A0A6P8GLU4_CLUHA|nr:C-type lectin domain family 4 member E-like [Clupea harengus]